MGVLDGQVAIVTGAGQGVGRGIALAVSHEGARVMVLGRTVSKCEAVVGEIAARSGEAVAEECNVESRDQIESSVQCCVARWGRIDLLVNNANTWTYESIRKITDEDMETMLAVRADGVPPVHAKLLRSSARVARLRHQHRVRHVPQPVGGHWGYSMTKEAVRVLSRVGAVEWGRLGIRVNSIYPIAMSPYIDAREGGDPTAIDRLAALIPLGRLGDPEADVGRSVVYLASDAGRYVTGTTLMVEGGFNYLR
jgi:NAD(P)-dependent dehydrogenase (short-subunit alcohol dehydrogenase family)